MESTTTGNKKEYCRDCGFLLKPIHFDDDGHSIETGEFVYVPRCVNQRCREGCGNTVGHRFSYWTGKCKNCGGYDPYNY
jgi:hypothetical protein